jgi:hypothetical protein
MKIKNIKLRSSRIKALGDDSKSSDIKKIGIICPDDCYEKLVPKKMNPEEFPINSATFIKISKNQYKIEFKLKPNVNTDSFTIVGPFSSFPNVSFERSFEYSKQNKVVGGTCTCENLYSLRNIFRGTYYIPVKVTVTEEVTVTLTEFVTEKVTVETLPVYFIVFNQEGYYYYLNVDKDNNVIFSSISL